MSDKARLTIKAKTRLKKYAEGVDPIEGQPFEVTENEEVLEGHNAVQLLEALNIKLKQGGA